MLSVLCLKLELQQKVSRVGTGSGSGGVTGVGGQLSGDSGISGDQVGRGEW